MPTAPTYPGVYIEEVPSGVHTITGVATSITAFIGQALRGPTNKAVTLNCFGDFERVFGGLWTESSLGYAVRDFYLNGGSQAIVVRLYHPDAAMASKAKVVAGSIKLEAAYEGKWGTNLRASVDLDVSAVVAASMGLAAADLFNLTIRDSAAGGITERFSNVSFKNGPRRVDKVLEAGSTLVRWSSDPNDAINPAKPPAIAAAQDAGTDSDRAYPDQVKAVRDASAVLTAANMTLAAAKAANPQVQADIDAATKAADAANKAKTKAEEALAATVKALKDLSGSVSDGTFLTKTDDFTPADAQASKKGLYALEQSERFNILCIPPYLVTTTGADVDASLISEACAYCETRRAIMLIDSPSQWSNKDKAKAGIDTDVGDPSKNAALFFPRLRQPNPLRNNQLEDFAPCGAVAGVFARTDAQRGVWKAPAGLDATLVGVPGFSVSLTDAENGELNPKGINCLRSMGPAGRVVWGSRTRNGNDQLASEWKYIPIRRTALFIEESIYQGTQWAVFEPNDEPLWAQLRLNIGVFMNDLFRQGAFQGRTPREAYFVKCDKETTTQSDINKGIVNVVVGFAPLKPAEFVVIKLQQIAGQLDT